MSRLGLPFYGLTLSLEDKLRVHQELFYLWYNSNGGVTHDEAYSMPVYLRNFNLRMIMEQRKKEADQAREQSMFPKPKGVARPAISRKPA